MLPINLNSLNKLSARVLRGLKTANLRILVDASAAAPVLRHARKQLFPIGDSVICEVVVFGQSEKHERPHLSTKADLNLLIAGSSDYNSLLICQAKEFDIPLVSIACDLPLLIASLKERDSIFLESGELKKLVEDIIPVPLDVELDTELLDALLAELGTWVARKLIDTRQSFARAYPFMREAVCAEIIANTAFINGIIAAVFFIPGADMPVLTANQLRMVIQIASVYGLELGSERIKEAAVIVLSAFGSRSLARLLVSRLSVIAWAIRGSLGYGMTYALGAVAVAYYQQLMKSE
jgi:uncharacterized protein (DUF697 family)